MLKVPYSILAPSIVLICAIGVYSMKNNIDDVVMMVLFGVVGYVLRKLQFELGPILLAFVLGRILERSLRKPCSSRGDLGIFLTKPFRRRFWDRRDDDSLHGRCGGLPTTCAGGVARS